MLTKEEQIQQQKLLRGIPSRAVRKRKKYSDNFNLMFTFFLRAYRVGLLDFCGVAVKTRFDVTADEAKFCFRTFDNGEYTKELVADGIITRHPHVLRAVIVGKKAWGLFVQETTSGICDMLFTKKEILDQFKEYKIEIPYSLLVDFNNQLSKKWYKKYNSGKITSF